MKFWLHALIIAGCPCFGLDALGRVDLVTKPGDAVVNTDYAGVLTTITDEANISRRNTADALGRLTKVEELGAGYTTTYASDALDNLIQVSQSGQSRTFAYDRLSRLTQATNPESGITKYAYDANGNLLRKVDARNMATCFYTGICSATAALGSDGYDGLNRPTEKRYSDATPPVTFAYDAAQTVCFNEGRLTSVFTAGVSTTALSCYDALGRVTVSSQDTVGDTLRTFAYTYNRDGSLATQTYPSSELVVAYQYDAAGRPKAAGKTTVGATDYASAIAYAPHGAVSSLTLGNGLVETTGFNNRLQPTSIQAGSLMTLTFGYGTTSNNGNVLSQTINRPGILNVTQTYGYDGVNRLQSITEGPSLSRTFGYGSSGEFGSSGTAPEFLTLLTSMEYSHLTTVVLGARRGSGNRFCRRRLSFFGRFPGQCRIEELFISQSLTAIFV